MLAKLFAGRSQRRRPLDALAYRMRHEDDVSIMVSGRERLQARCEELKFQTGNRATTLATMKRHQLVRGGIWAERETVGQLRLALRELRHEEEELQPVRKKLLPPGWRYQVEEIKELATDEEALIRDMLRWCE